MDSLQDRVDQQPANELPAQPSVEAEATQAPFDSKADAYAEAELVRRHRRIELMIEKANSPS